LIENCTRAQANDNNENAMMIALMSSDERGAACHKQKMTKHDCYNSFYGFVIK